MDENDRRELIDKLVAIGQGQQHLEQRIRNLELSLNKLGNTIEHDLSDKIGALFDAQTTWDETIRNILTTLEQVTLNISTLQMETAHIRRVK